MYIDPTLVNTIFAVGLVIFSLCFVVFLIFFVPVLIQLARTLEAIQTVASLIKEYSLNLNEKLADASEGISKVKQLALNLSSAFLDYVMNLMKKN